MRVIPRLRFSVRTLAIMVTVICLYFGSWLWVRDRALLDVAEFTRRKTLANLQTVVQGSSQNATISADVFDFHDPSTVIPFVISVRQWDFTILKPKPLTLKTAAYSGRKYYVWLFGLKVRLPYEGPPRRRTIRIRIRIRQPPHAIDHPTS